MTFRHFLFQNAPFQAKINNEKCFRKVRFSSSKYTKIRPIPNWGAYKLQCSPVRFQGPLHGRGGEGKGVEEGEAREGRKRKGKGMERSPVFYNLTIQSSQS